ncbi:hypothetical protein KA344_14885 [bacterium]|nr:hypothetical protein [bacterium]
MKIIALSLVTMAIASATAAQPASAKEFGRSEKAGDMNMLQVEPSIINERFYTSGKADRQQFCGKVLPAGAPIPDNDAPLSEQKPVAKESKETTAVKEVKETPSVKTSKDAAVKPATEKVSPSPKAE